MNCPLLRVATLFTVACSLVPPVYGQAPVVDTALYGTLSWRNIGPFRGGRSVAVAGVPQKPHTFYFGATGGGVWKTEDAGETWANISDGFLKTGSVGAIAVAPSDPNVIYVGMGEHAVRGVMTSHGDGVYRSTDAGATWHHLGLIPTRHISRIQVHPNDPDVVYVASQGAVHGPNPERGIYRSRDGGKTWALVHKVSETAGASDLAMDPTNPRILYAAYWDHQRLPWQVRSGGPGSGLWKSVDGGDTWAKLSGGLPPLMGKTGVSVSPVDPNLIWAIVEAEKGGLYRSEDAGRNWRLINGDRLIQTRSWYYMEVYADTRDRETVYVLNAPFLRSIDGGRTFQEIRVGHGDTHDLWISPADNRVMILGDDGGAEVTINGGKTWSTQNNQPTAQFYRVNTDNRFPYRVYGGQQDNSSVAILSRNPAGFGITDKDWFDGPGCESAHIAFDPDNPRYLYGGCYQGIITEMDTETRYDRDVMAYPATNLSIEPKDHRYRFNWNAPILASPHDPKVIYHAGNVLFRTADRGNNWTAISPDLTRNDRSRQGPGGTPITNEGAGGEVYNTIATVAESPKQSGLIWVGTDDGLVQLTRDGGRSWENVTPKGLPEALVNAVEASPHDAGTAYIAVTRYKFNDFTPHFYRTRDFGKTWDRIVNGVPADTWARVIREDPVRRGLLYAGTEAGALVSFNGGDTWQSLQRNLPVVPVTDLKVQGNDLVAATSGRAFWILDDLGVLRQLSGDVAQRDVALLTPAPTHRVPGGGFSLPLPRIGQNPPSGAQLRFFLKNAPDSANPVTLEVLDAAGGVVRSWATRPAAGSSADSLRAKAGMNLITWNLRHGGPRPIPGLVTFGGSFARRALPGDYQVRLTAGTTVQTAPLSVLTDPRTSHPSAAYAEQGAASAELQQMMTDLLQGVRGLRAAREQVVSLVTRSEGRPESAAIKAAGDSLAKRLADMDDGLVGKATNGQDIINYPTRFDTQVAGLLGSIDGAEPPLTAGQKARLVDVRTEWARHKAALDQLLGRDLDVFNALVREKGVPAVVVPR
ncbi:MAG TPA: glycosyl hydrolase [Gemmatimonadales bacterium]